MNAKFLLMLAASTSLVIAVCAQSPAPVVIQAIAPGAAPAPAVPAPIAPASSDATLKTLQEIKAANEAILSKQAAALEQLEEMEKSADQIKIYTKRG